VSFYPSPSTRRRALPHHTDAETLELEARAGVYARPRHEPMDGLSGMPLQAEQTMRGWTAQQPFVHVDCPVQHLCVMCALVVDPDYLRDHARDCAVTLELVS
jgi:hypothetical protein